MRSASRTCSATVVSSGIRAMAPQKPTCRMTCESASIQSAFLRFPSQALNLPDSETRMARADRLRLAAINNCTMPRAHVNDFTDPRGDGQRVGEPVVQPRADQCRRPAWNSGRSKKRLPSNIEGLPTWFDVRVSALGYQCRARDFDVLVALNATTWAARRRRCQAGRRGHP